MPLSLYDLVSEVSEPLEVNIGTEDAPKIVTIKYKPNALTPALEDKIFAVSQRSQIGSVYRAMLLETLERWDIEGTLPPYPDAIDDGGDSEESYKKRQSDIEKLNKERTALHILPVNQETLSLVPISVLEKIIVAIQAAQSPKKSMSKSSPSSFGAAPVAPYQRGTA